MFSNITNQFTSLVGAVKGGQSEEEAGATTTATTNQPEIVTTAATTAQQQQQQPHEVAIPPETTAEAAIEGDDSKSGWLGSAKGWLGSASIPSMPAMPSMPSMPSMPAMPSMPTIPSIPGLRKGNNDADVAASTEGTNNVNINAPSSNVGNASGTLGVEDDDKSRYISATEGADSHPASGGGTPTNDEGQIGQGKDFGMKITTKVTQQAKHFGSFLTSAISKAGTKITETVKSNPILESFNKEQEAFIKGQSGSNNQGMAPWVGHPNEAKIKEEILGLSQDRRNFVRAPPAGVDFDFNYDTVYSTAVAIMAEDKALETMRFELVPKIITEENFWRNYFYRVSLIIQAAELGTLGEDGVAQASSGEDDKSRKSLQFGIKTTETPEVVKSELARLKLKLHNDRNRKSSINDYEIEFRSDSYQDIVQNSNKNANENVKEIQENLHKLNLSNSQKGDDKRPLQNNNEATSLSNDEEQWEKELEAELKDYEVVGHAGADGISNLTTTTRKTITTTTEQKIRTTTTTTAAATATRTTKASENCNDIVNNVLSNAAEADGALTSLTNVRTRTMANEWEEYADLIEDTDDLK